MPDGSREKSALPGWWTVRGSQNDEEPKQKSVLPKAGESRTRGHRYKVIGKKSKGDQRNRFLHRRW